MAVTEEQLDSIQAAERTTAVLSLVGCSFIIVTFTSSTAFRKPINRLIFYASFGNIMAAIAMLIARQGPIDGQNSASCQLQAFFIQQWMPADPLWSFCMAFNVYLTYYKRYSVAQLRSLEWKYFLVCYGAPTIPNLTMFFIHTQKRGKVYGSAITWCSIAIKWRALRFACFYVPVWLISLGTLTIFLKVGHDVYRVHRTLRRSSTIVSPNSAEFGHIEIQPSPAARSYLRYSLLFFIAMVVTWLPASVNRIYSLVNPTGAIYPLLFTAAAVLPLQGFWNALIYFTTSFPICSELFTAHIMAPIRRRRGERETLHSVVSSSNWKSGPGTPSRPASVSRSSSWTFWSRDRGREIDLKPGGTAPAQVGEIALPESPSQMHAESAV